MGRRHDALIPLTHDHHHTLVNARRVKQAAGADLPARVEAAQAFVAFFRSEAVGHFREEEEVVFPLVVGHPDAPLDLLTKILLEHIELHAMVTELESQIASGDVAAATLAAIGTTLQAHVRAEEDELFPKIEELVADRLGGLTLAPRSRR